VVKTPFERSEEETVFILIHQKYSLLDIIMANFLFTQISRMFFSRRSRRLIHAGLADVFFTQITQIDSRRSRGCFFHAVPMAIGIADVFFTQITQIDSR
jgi:hypothetical protein